MKKIIALSLVWCAAICHAQKVPYTEQEFVLRDIKVKEKPSTFRSGIEIGFKVFGKYNRNQVQPDGNRLFPVYRLHFSLVDVNGDTLIHDEFRQSFSFFDVDTGKYRSYSFGHSMAIPYPSFKKTGEQSFYIYGQAQSSDGSIKLKPFRAGPYRAVIPKVVPLSRQQIKLGNVTAVEDTEAKGIYIKFSSILSHDAHELYSEKESTDEIFFYVDFTDEEGNPVNFPNDPEFPGNQKNLFNYYRIKHQKNITKNGEIYFPYTDFYIPQGRQKIRYAIHATSYRYSVTWDSLGTGELTIDMPAVYFAKAGITGLHVKEKQYDVSAGGIPLIGMFIPSKSKSGKGYPDLFWTFGTKKRNYIKTDIVKNTFNAPDGHCSFQMTEDDRPELNVYDYDVFSGNDYLGGLTVPRLSGANTYRTSIRNGDVTDGLLTLERSPRPDAKNMALFSKITQFQGVTGYQIWGNVGKDSSVSGRFFLRKPDGSNEQPARIDMEPYPAGADFSYFIPAYDLDEGSVFGLLAQDTYYQLPVFQRYVRPEKYIRETRDVSVQINPLQIAQRNGVEGLFLKIDVTYPAILSKDRCHFSYRFKDLSGIDLKKIIDRLHMESLPVCPNSTCPMSVFIPFYALHRFSGKELRGHLEADIKIKNSFVIGKDEDTLQAAVPAVMPSPRAQLAMDMKFVKNWSYVNMVVEYDKKQKVFVKERTEGGKLSVDVEFPTEYLAENDIVYIKIIPYEFRTPLQEITWEIKVKSLKDGPITLPKNKHAKKVVLKTY